MPITITGVTALGGSTPSHVRVSGTKTSCESVIVWVGCGEPLAPTGLGTTTPQSGDGPWSVDVPVQCPCGSTIKVWADCDAGLGKPSPTSTILTQTLDCGACCPSITLNPPAFAGTAAHPTVGFTLAAPPLTWIPAGCIPQPAPTGFTWTLSDGSGPRFRLSTGTATPQADTGTGAWVMLPGAGPASVPLSLAAGSWAVKVKANFAAALPPDCDATAAMPFQVMAPPPCCPAGDPNIAPYGVSVAASVTGAPPLARFVASVFWPPGCTPVTPTGYLWQLTSPSGAVFTRRTAGPTADTAAGWGPGAPGAVALAPGVYAVQCALDLAGTAAFGCVAFNQNSFELAGTPQDTCCPSVNLTASVSAETPSRFQFDATTSGCPGLLPSAYTWQVVDGGTGQVFQKQTSVPSTDESGFNPPLVPQAGSTYAVTVTPSYAGTGPPPGCDATSAPASLSPPAAQPPQPFSLCCVLIVAWAILNAVFGVLLYYGVYRLWPVGTIVLMVVGGVATILFGVWLVLCYRACALAFWRCCPLWQWQLVSVGWIVMVLGVIEFFCGTLHRAFIPCGDTWVFALYSGYLIGLLAALSAVGRCGRLPNPFDPTTWPPCCCSGVTPCP